MEEKILKIVNILGRFSIEDVAAYLECDENDIAPYIKRFEEDEILTKLTDDLYLYDKSNRTKLKKKLIIEQEKTDFNYIMPKNKLFNLENFRKFPAEQVFTKKRDLDYYNKSDERMKKLLIKHIVLFSLVGYRPFAETKIYLYKIAKEFPEYKMDVQWYRIKYKRYMEEGLPGLYQNKLCTIDNKAYEEFKKMYLSPKRYTGAAVYELLKMKGFDSDSLPSVVTFMHRLKSEYSEEAIKIYRSDIKKGHYSNGVVTFKQVKGAQDVLFETAVQEYFNILASNKIQISKAKRHNIFKVGEYFGKYKLRNISTEEILKYRKMLVSKGYSVGTVRGMIVLILEILKMNRIIIDATIFDIIIDSYKIYTEEEIKEIIKKCGPEAWIISLGLKLTELQALEYEDITYDKGEVLINKCYHGGKIIKYHNFKAKPIKMPKFLLNNIDKSKTGLIFGQIEMPTYESCLCTHIKLLQDQNIPMNLIAKEMRYNDIKTFYTQFHQLFPKEFEPDFDILEPLNII